jgi:Tfp pilus assembly protein PilX
VIARLRDQSGQALVLGLVTMAVLATLTTAAALEVTVNHRNAGHSADADKAFAIAQLGLSYAEGRVYAAAAAHTTPATGATSFSQDGGTGTYAASVAADGISWTMTATATYNGITKTVTAQANVPSPITVNDGSVWNYLYADSTSGCTSISNNTIITVPIFIRGNLCMANSAQITGATVEIGGNVTFANTSSIGASATSKISRLEVAGTCNGVAPGTGTCNGNQAPVWANSVQSTLSVDLHMPSIDFGGAYLSSNPGPATGHSCGAGSTGVPANFFDNDTVQNNSISNVATNLFPNSDYNCKNSSGVSVLAWNHTTNTLTLNGGPFYFDGNLTVGSSTTINYVGQAVLYVSGTVAFNGSSGVCGIASCTQSWNPDVNGLILAAGCWQSNSDGSTLVTAALTGIYCMDINTTKTVQFGSYVATDYRMRSGSNMGPVLANSLTLVSGSSSLIPFHYMPPGTPLNSQNVYLPATAPTNWAG